MTTTLLTFYYNVVKQSRFRAVVIGSVFFSVEALFLVSNFDKFEQGDYTLCLTTEILLEYEEKIGEIFSPMLAELIVGAMILKRNTFASHQGRARRTNHTHPVQPYAWTQS